GQQPSWKRHNGDPHEQQSIEQQERVINAVNKGEHVMMADPHEEYGDEADDVGQIGWPLLVQGLEQCLTFQLAGQWHSDVEYEQCNGDGKHAVAEGFKACGVTPGGRALCGVAG